MLCFSEYCFPSTVVKRAWWSGTLPQRSDHTLVCSEAPVANNHAWLQAKVGKRDLVAQPVSQDGSILRPLMRAGALGAGQPLQCEVRLTPVETQIMQKENRK